MAHHPYQETSDSLNLADLPETNTFSIPKLSCGIIHEQVNKRKCNWSNPTLLACLEFTGLRGYNNPIAYPSKTTDNTSTPNQLQYLANTVPVPLFLLEMQESW